MTYVPVHEGKGYADNGSIIRVDVFKKDGKFYSVPVHARYIGNKELPTLYAPLKENKHVDETFEFLFSLYLKDLVRLTNSNGTVEWLYYVTMNCSKPGNYEFKKHDLVDKIFRGIKMCKNFEKYYVDILGFKHRVFKEKRKSLI